MKSVYCLFVFFLISFFSCVSSVKDLPYFNCEFGVYYMDDLHTSCEAYDKQFVITTCESLVKAVKFDDLGTVKKILECIEDFSHVLEDDLTLLHIAAIGGSLNVIEYLVTERHFDINAITDFDELTPLAKAAEAGKVEAVKLLLKLGADKNITFGSEHNTLLHVAVIGGDVEVWKLLLQTFHVDVRNDNDETPAYIAARDGKHAALRFLLENGADPYTRYEYDSKRTLMHVAVSSNQVGVVRELTRYKELINTPDITGDLPIDIISNMKVVKVLVDAGSNITEECIWMYISYHNNIVKYLVEKSSKVNRQITWSATPPCNRHLLTKFLEKRVKYGMIEFLLKQGADVNIKDCKNKTALHIALESYKKEKVTLAIVQLLLNRVADVNVPDASGLTALDYAKQRGFHKVEEYLRKFGATTLPSQLKSTQFKGRAQQPKLRFGK